MTKYHFKQAKKQHDDTIMTHMRDSNDQIRYTQLEIEKILMDYWANIMRKRTTNTIMGPVSSTQKIINSIIKTLPPESIICLGKNTDPTNYNNGSNKCLRDFISRQCIFDSIKKSKLNKAPGIDGLPIEFFDALALNPDSTIIRFLQDVYVHSYNSKILPASMRKSQMRLLYKKESHEDKQYPKTIDQLLFLASITKFYLNF